MKIIKRVALLLLVLTIFFSVIPVAQAVDQYPPDHVWNVPVDTLPVDSMSKTYITSSNAACSGGCYLYVGRGTPLNVVDSTHAKQKLTSITALWRSDDVPYPIPNDSEISIRRVKAPCTLLTRRQVWITKCISRSGHRTERGPHMRL